MLDLKSISGKLDTYLFQQAYSGHLDDNITLLDNLLKMMNGDWGTFKEKKFILLLTADKVIEAKDAIINNEVNYDNSVEHSQNEDDYETLKNNVKRWRSILQKQKSVCLESNDKLAIDNDNEQSLISKVFSEDMKSEESYIRENESSGNANNRNGENEPSNSNNESDAERLSISEKEDGSNTKSNLFNDVIRRRAEAVKQADSGTANRPRNFPADMTVNDIVMEFQAGTVSTDEFREIAKKVCAGLAENFDQATEIHTAASDNGNDLLVRGKHEIKFAQKNGSTFARTTLPNSRVKYSLTGASGKDLQTKFAALAKGLAYEFIHIQRKKFAEDAITISNVIPDNDNACQILYEELRRVGFMLVNGLGNLDAGFEVQNSDHDNNDEDEENPLSCSNH